jgi:hypothetical protein
MDSDSQGRGTFGDHHVQRPSRICNLVEGVPGDKGSPWACSQVQGARGSRKVPHSEAVRAEGNDSRYKYLIKYL